MSGISLNLNTSGSFAVTTTGGYISGFTIGNHSTSAIVIDNEYLWGQKKIYSNISHDVRIESISRLILAEIAKFRLDNDSENQTISEIALGPWDWLNFFREEFPNLNPTIITSINWKGYEIVLDGTHGRHITIGTITNSNYFINDNYIIGSTGNYSGIL